MIVLQYTQDMSCTLLGEPKLGATAFEVITNEIAAIAVSIRCELGAEDRNSFLFETRQEPFDASQRRLHRSGASAQGKLGADIKTLP